MKIIFRLTAASFILSLAACAPNNVTKDDTLKKYFDENKVTGTFGLFDNGQGMFTVYNLGRYKDSTYLPASTFKIISSMVGIQTGRISGEKMIIPWDGIIRKFPNGDTATAWNKDLTMEEAFKVSAVPYYQEVSRRIGKDTMQRWLDTLGYGSRYKKFQITNNIDTFWLDNSLKVTPDEQLGLVKKLYFNQLPFQGRPQDIVKKLMLQESNSNYKLSYKTGWGNTENGDALGWIIGWIEENQHPYFFVLNVEGPHDTDITTVRKNILDGILKQLGFFEGKK
ncbi:class D beta-lactamase [Panacibacter ginsenosidivorans]|uniref:beta-lactamase n=1 Tax=Panacibacter ginsenosidivorans TaxID=1813871 RepID=A0A5B8V8G1_9BACT|nr:penicillin-binding transpeptidase domain-containing protein [Panacibacter ginsenosidivorans]QEC67519.1 class D beta-lactamase [Panacibacter ginsenosidivorans]